MLALLRHIRHPNCVTPLEGCHGQRGRAPRAVSTYYESA